MDNRVLVVDDEEHVRKLYMSALSREGYEVDTAADGKEALAIIKQRDINAIVLDIELEEESGLELLKRFKSVRPDLPIILNTAYSVYMSDFKTWVADAYIVKSSDMQPLIDKLDELVGVPRE